MSPLIRIDSRDIANIITSYSAKPIGTLLLISNDVVVYEGVITSLPFACFPPEIIPVAALCYADLSAVVLTDDGEDEFILTSKCFLVSHKERRKLLTERMSVDFGDKTMHIGDGKMLLI
jgi:hypothetical protein